MIAYRDCCFNIDANKKKACWILTKHCNLNCDYCCIDSTKLSALDHVQVYNLNGEINHLLKNKIKKVILSGGEPFLINNLDQICKSLSEKGIEYSIMSNGMDVDFNLMKKNNGLNKIIINSSNIHNENIYRKLNENLNKLSGLNLKIKLTLVLTPEVIESLPRFYEIIRNNNIYEVSLIQPQNKGRSKDNQKIDAQIFQEIAKEALVINNNLKINIVDPKCTECNGNEVFSIVNGSFSKCIWKIL